jgi:2-polyprenyl-3-methyl-5-hydroxy-6-metoxy-1,4-benzoquinol methylase
LGLTERKLVERGLRVAAVPLDPVICSGAAANGVEMVYGDLRAAKAQLETEKFDCVLCLNVLHLVREPAELLSWLRSLLSSDSVLIIQTPNMMSVPAIRERLRGPQDARFAMDYDLTGVHFSSVGKMRNWCKTSGLRIERTTGILHRQAEMVRSVLPGFVRALAPKSLIYSMATSIVMSAKKQERAALS